MWGLIYNVIFIAILYYVFKKYGYWTNVIFYTIGKGVIYNLLFNHSSFGVFIILLMLRFFIGMIFIKILEKVDEYFNNNGASFLITAIVLEGLIEWIVGLLLSL